MDNTGANPQGIVVPPVEGVAGGGTAYGWNDGGGVHFSSSSLKGSIDPSEVLTSELVHAWCMPSTANVGPQEMPSHLEPLEMRESVQIGIRPKATWGGSGSAGVVHVQCTDLISTSGDRLVFGQSITLRRVVPILGFPDALVPLDLPVSQINLSPGETTALWVSIDVPSAQPPGQYKGEFFITAIKAEAESSSQCLGKADRHQLYMELRNCLDIMEPVEGKPLDEVVERAKCVTASLRRVLLSPVISEFVADNGRVDLMDEDAISNLSVHVKLDLTVWDFILPATPSLPAVFGISDTVIEDRFVVEHGSDEWYEVLDQHFKWLLQYRISPYFCRLGGNMRVLTYTCPWPDEYFSDQRLAAFAVPYSQAVPGNSAAKDCLQREIEILRTKSHWKKAYFYLWDEPLNLEQYDMVRNMASKIHAYAPDAHVLTTYYCGPSDAPLGPTPFEAFVKVPKFLRPHTQIYCTSFSAVSGCLVIERIGPRKLSLNCSQRMVRNGGHMCVWDPLFLILIGTLGCVVLNTVLCSGVYGTGFLYWGANCYEKATVPSAEIRFRHGLPPGDGVLYYPGEVFSSSRQPVASVRLERILCGLQDFEYLQLYTSRYGRDEGLALLEKTGLYLGPERYTLEHMPIDVMRREIFNACRS